ncbi:MAG TPA: hypothetical protein VH234_01620 [Candidatus Saccharimonadales bacterium]|nr:hypothetical protein [Candidatus Saccharimonadales bacterium]
MTETFDYRNYDLLDLADFEPMQRRGSRPPNIPKRIEAHTSRRKVPGEFSILSARRVMAKQDLIRLGTLLTKALTGAPVSDYSRSTRNGASLATRRESRHILLRGYRDDDGELSTDRFNRAARRGVNRVNRTQADPISVRLGEVGIFGADKNDSDDRRRFVGFHISRESRLEQEGYDRLIKGRETYLSVVIPKKDPGFVKVLMKRNPDPHISVAHTFSQDTAECLQETLHEASISGIWVSLMQAQEKRSIVIVQNHSRLDS